MTGMSMVITVTALAGTSLAPRPGLGTLPLSLQFVATMATALPAAFIMRRLGRRAGFSIGSVAGMLGGLASAAALVLGHFPLFCVGAALIGVLAGFAVHYRFAAADSADENGRARAISLVLAGGVVAAFTGPNLARYSADALAGSLYAGSFLALAALQILILLTLTAIRIPRLSPVEQAERGRPSLNLLANPVVLVAVLAGVAGYSSMTLIMTATPLAVMGHAHSFPDTAFVIQWHVFAMFAPSFFTGHLIRRFGVLPVILAGGLLNGVCIAINLTGTSLAHFTVALFALGIGWNFMFVGATTLLTSSLAKSEQHRMQGLNDALVYGAVALAALGSGALHQEMGWALVNLATVPALVLAVGATLLLLLRQRKPHTA